jgi:hypothetical protein
MTQDEIIEIYKEVSNKLCDGKEWCWAGVEEPLQLFAKLVAEHEREACAEVCKKHADVYAMLEQNPTAKSAWAACIDTRDAIRARQ